MEERSPLVRAPTLAHCGELYTFSLPDMPRIAAAIPGAGTAILPGTGVPAVDHRPELFPPQPASSSRALPARAS